MQFVYFRNFLNKSNINENLTLLDIIKTYFDKLKDYYKYPVTCFTKADNLKMKIENISKKNLGNFRILLYFNDSNLIILENDKSLFDYKVRDSALVIIERKLGDEWESDIFKKQKSELEKLTFSIKKYNLDVGLENIGNSNNNFILS